MADKHVIMLSTSIHSPGGIGAVVSLYASENLFAECSIEHIPTHVNGSRRRKLCIFIVALLKFLHSLITQSVSAVHAHTASRSSFWRKSAFFFIARLFGKPYIFHLHGAEFNKFYWNESGFFIRFLIKYVLGKSHTIIVLSQRWKSDISKITSNKSIIVVPNAVSLPDICEKAKISKSILYLGFIEKRKGIYDLLPAMKKLHLKYPDISLLVGGTGQLEKAKLIANELGLSKNVTFLGWVKGDSKTEYLNKAEIFFLVSYDEGLPIALLEAMSYGLPVITSPVGGIPEAVNDGVEGFLIEPGDVKGIAAALDRLVSEPTLRGRMGSAGRQRIEKEFSPSVVFPILKAIYRDIDRNLVHSA